MTWRKLQEFYLKGKVFVIGLTFFDKDGQLIERYQTHGTAIELTINGLLRIRREDGSIFQLPYDKDTIEKAKKGEYRAKTTGEVIPNPDYLMTWEITLKEKENIEISKKYGFVYQNKENGSC